MASALGGIGMNHRGQGPQTQVGRHGRRDLADHLPGMTGHDGRPQNPIGARLDVDLHEAFVFPSRMARSTSLNGLMKVLMGMPRLPASASLRPTWATSGSV